MYFKKITVHSLKEWDNQQKKRQKAHRPIPTNLMFGCLANLSNKLHKCLSKGKAENDRVDSLQAIYRRLYSGMLFCRKHCTKPLSGANDAKRPASRLE